MGQPITLAKDGNELIVYGRSQAAVHVAQGYQYTDSDVAAAGVRADDLTALRGVNEDMAAKIAGRGWTTYEAVAEAPVKEMTAIKGIGPKLAATIKGEAARLAGL
jgi:transcription termination factor NusA